MACILSELYSGELLFPTHENIEHLSLMEKVSGPFPKWMVEGVKGEFRDCFVESTDEQSEAEVQLRDRRMKWPECAKKQENVENWKDMKRLEVRLVGIILNKW